MAARYFVGFGEAGFGPVIPFYLARWYTKRDLALRMSIFLFSGPLAGVINGLVSYGVSFIKGSLAPWRILFIIEGCPAILAGVFALSILPGDVMTTRWLTEKERACGESSVPVLCSACTVSHASQFLPARQGKLLLSLITSTGDRQLVSYGAGKSFYVNTNLIDVTGSR
jgi:MFS family permease